MSFVVHSRHSTSLQIASLDCELLTRGDSRRVTRERFPAPNPPCSYGPSYLAQLPRISYYVRLTAPYSLSCCTAKQFDVGQFADNLAMNDLCTAPEVLKSWHEQAKPGQ